MKKIAIVYLPNGIVLHFTTTDLGDSNYQLVENITTNGYNSLIIANKDIDGTVSNETFVGIPYSYEEWSE